MQQRNFAMLQRLTDLWPGFLRGQRQGDNELEEPLLSQQNEAEINDGDADIQNPKTPNL